MNRISQITYALSSGPILPELQFHEELVITRSTVTLSRNGRAAGSMINAGTWAVPADGVKLAALFRQLETVNCAKLRRIEPADPPDGGHSEGYTLLYSNGKTCALLYDPGVTYSGGELVVKPVQAFIQGLSLPAGVASQHR